jgi:ribulose-phosphate 3-epimerase
MEFRRSVSPSLLAADYGALADAALEAEAGGAGSLHLDYMDGHYVPNISFGIELIPALKKRVKIPLVAHLMISNADERLDDFIRVRPDYIIVQEDAVKDLHRIMKRLHDEKIKPGLAINPDRPLHMINDYLPFIEYLIILSVHPGFGGQSFLDETLVKMEKAHKHRINNKLNYDIAVDGGVNMKTASGIVKTGANVLVAGTAVFTKPDIRQAILDLLTV